MTAQIGRRRSALVVLALVMSCVLGGALPARAAELHRVSGSVTGASTLVHGTLVTVYRRTADGWSWYDEVRATGSTFEAFLPDGTYALQIAEDDSEACPTHTTEWYDDAPSQEQARPVVVDGADVDLAPVELAERIPVRGVVLNRQGQPATDVEVRQYTATGWGVIGSTLTDDAGRFTLLVDPGSWRFRLATLDRRYYPIWYPQTESELQAAVVAVASTPVDLGTLTVSTGGYVAGRVTDSTGASVAQARVTVTDDRGYVEGRVDTDGSGRYRWGGLPSGEYRVYVEHPDHQAQYYGGARTFPDSEAVPVGLYDPADLPDITLSESDPREPYGLRLTGVIRSAAGVPLAGIEVEAFNQRSSDPPMVTMITDAEGRYYFLDPQRISMWASTSWSVYVNDYDWADKTRPSAREHDLHLVDPFVVPATGWTSVPDIIMPLSSGISGRVTLPSGAPAAGAVVTVFRSDDDWGRAAETTTGPDGSYAVSGLTAGVDYRVAFSATPLPSYQPVWWWSGGSTYEDSTPVVLTPEEMRSSISGVLGATAPPPDAVPNPVPDPVPVLPGTMSGDTRVATKLVASARLQGRRVRIMTRVVAPGVSDDSGSIAVSTRGGTETVIASKPDGSKRWRVDFPVRSGRHVYVVRYSGTASTTPSRTRVVVTVGRGRHRADRAVV